MCLGILMSFKEPTSISEDILGLAQKVRETVIDGVPYMQDSPRGEDQIYEDEKLRVKYTDEPPEETYSSPTQTHPEKQPVQGYVSSVYSAAQPFIQSATIGAKLAAQGIKSAKEAAFPFISPLSSYAQQAKSTV